jgi:D-3-phosphoglycerate dehydrogenase
MKILCITPVKHISGVYGLLETCGSVTYFPDLDKQQMINLDKYEYDYIFCNPNKQKFILNKETLGNFIGRIVTASTGINHIDLEYCKKARIPVQSLTKEKNLIKDLPSTSELAFGLMISLLRKIPQGQNHVANYGWDYEEFMGRQVKDLNIGIVGYGRLGRMMAIFCKAFGAKVYIHDPYIKNVKTHSLEDLFDKCDVISLHVHVTDETRGMINKRLLERSQHDLYIVNTSRGEIVEENDIVSSLKNGYLAGYATDVLVDEFDDLKKSPIIQAMNEGHNIIVTPHVGGMTWEGQHKAYEWAINKMKKGMYHWETQLSKGPYSTDYDSEGRNLIIEQVQKYAQKKAPASLVLIGSPDCKEIQSLPLQTRKRINLIVFDSKKDRTPQDIRDSFKTYKFYCGSFFDNAARVDEKVDIIIHRWFLHHCTDEQKQESFQTLQEIVSASGKVLIIDWFIPDYKDNEDRYKQCIRYYKYQERYGLAPRPSRAKRNFDNVDKTDGRGGKFTSTKKLESMLTSNNFTFERKLMCTNLVDNPELFGQNLYICTLNGEKNG